MTTQVSQTPGGIAFAGFYYPELEREVRAFFRNNKGILGLTDENDLEVHIQLALAFVLMGHTNNTRLDMLATEMFLDSAQLLESVRLLLQLQGLKLRSASPARADLVAVLAASTTALSSQFVPGLAEFGTDSTPPIVYEGPSAGVDLVRTDQVEYVYALHETDSGTSGGGDPITVSASSPGVVDLTSGSWASDAVGQVLFLSESSLKNGGEFLVTERIDSRYLRVVKHSDSSTPAWVDETGLSWSLKEFSANLATAANTTSSNFQPWTTFAVGDILYVGHSQVMFDQIDIVRVAGSSTEMKGVWEHYDDQLSRFAPKSVTVTGSGSTLTFDLETLLGTLDRSGAQVTVTYLPTGESNTLTSTYSSGNKITTPGLLGQVTPSTTLTDYHVTALWIPLPDLVDGTQSGVYDMEQSGSITYTLPQTSSRRWNTTQINSLSGFWARYRILSLGGTAAEPTLDRIRIDQGTQALLLSVLQGETVGAYVVGSSNGQANQEIVLPRGPYLDDTALIEVDESGSGTWLTYTEKETHAESSEASRHYTLSVDRYDRGVVRFGDGVRGKIPPAAFNNIRATHRIGCDVDGNVGTDQITSNISGINGISSVYNPRPATGWRIKEGGDDASFARLKRTKPGELLTRGTATRDSDIEYLAVNEFVDRDGIKPVHRAWVVEEGMGLKQAKLVVVGEGGAPLTANQLTDLELYFNGDRYASPPVRGVLVFNHGVVAVNHQPRLITIVADVKWPGGNTQQIKNQLLAHLKPLALKEDGFSYRWDVGGSISFSNLYNLIHDVDPGISDIPTLTINGVASSYALGTDGLPYAESTTILVRLV